jgi:hypothetical protein
MVLVQPLVVRRHAIIIRCASAAALLLLVGRQLLPLQSLPLSISQYERETSLLLPVSRKANTPRRKRQRPTAKQVAVDDASIGMCVLMKDDNHWLIEWLAFHYHVLPLRDLVVVRDPQSRTSPQEIFDRWKTRINITEWDGDAVVPQHKWNQHRAGTIDDTRLHRARQQFFYADCLRHFKRAGKQWVLLTDTDEFIQPNLYLLNETDRHSLTEAGSVLKTLQQQTSARLSSQQLVPKCLHIPRIQLSSQQTTHSPNSTLSTLLPTMNLSHFLTTSWIHHNGKEIVQVQGANLDGKNLIHVGGMPIRDIPARAGSVHHVIPKHCPATNGQRLRHNDSWFVIYHYPGTYPQYTYREDPRDSLTHRKKRWDLWHEIGGPKATVRDESMGEWLPGFVAHVGQEEAERLLRNVGQLEELPALPDAAVS